MGRLDFKSSLRRSDPAAGEFDSHTLPPNTLKWVLKRFLHNNKSYLLCKGNTFFDGFLNLVHYSWIKVFGVLDSSLFSQILY